MQNEFNIVVVLYANMYMIWVRKPFRTPDEMETKNEEKLPVSTRVRASTKEYLKKAAQKKKKSISWLTENILEDYASWLKEQA